MNKKTKSPLKASPLRNPGQSLDEEIQDIVNDKVLPRLFGMAFFIVVAGFEWYRTLTNAPYTPWAFSIVAVLILVIGIWQLTKIRKQVQRLKLGRDGEKAVGQYLELLRQDGYKVFHDIIGDGFNIDHVVIGPTGVYTIETKTYSKSKKGNARIEFDGKTIRKNGLELHTDPVIQSKAQSRWLSELLGESTGRRVDAKGVVVFPGWFVESNHHGGIWVLNPKGLKAFMANRESVLVAEDVNLFAYHMSRIVRAIQSS